MLCCNWSQEIPLSSCMRNGGPNLRKTRRRKSTRGEEAGYVSVADLHFFFFFYMKHTCWDQEALLISWWHLARLFSWTYKKNKINKIKHFPLGRWHLVWLTQQQGCVACNSWYTHNKQTWLYGNNVSGLLRTENSSRSLKVFPLRPSVNHHVNFWLRLLSCMWWGL